MPGWIRLPLAYLAAVVIGGLATTILSTQIVLQYLVNAGAVMPLEARMAATLADLTGFAPTLILLTAIGYLIAFPVARLVSHRIGGLRAFGYVLAGFVTLMVMIYAIEVFYQAVLASTITPIGSGRDLWGLVILGIGGALGGAVFARLAKRVR
ncbi:MAG: hypothetical protein COW29_04560 [Rhodobacterales bacterium CG15_BIG_FIL_POST_REV_8_21_14_020_59_13]|nr:MAG: hypothetical protein COW29_04560 [Rhodobacterales bacterium CG15_BIG_FIL_POST_REV_8_21_14_020_59_13]